MRPSRKATWVAINILIPQLVACRSVTPVYAREFPRSARRADVVSEYEVSTSDGRSVVLTQVWIADSLLHGHAVARTAKQKRKLESVWGSVEVSIPLERIQTITPRKSMDSWSAGSFLLGTAIAVVAVLGMMVREQWREWQLTNHHPAPVPAARRLTHHSGPSWP